LGDTTFSTTLHLFISSRFVVILEALSQVQQNPMMLKTLQINQAQLFPCCLLLAFLLP
jgi:hypothetical protein